MSRYSGVCDLADWIFGQGGYYDKNGNHVNRGDVGVGVYYSDEMKDFLVFKQETGGVLHQHAKVKLSTWNQDEVAKHCPQLKIISDTRRVTDARTKLGYREETFYIYKYYGKLYTLEQLNKKGVYITIDIHFDTLLDLIPYYPYIVSMGCCSEGTQTVYISNEPAYVGEFQESLKTGGRFLFLRTQYYEKVLSKHIRDVVRKYFNPEGYEIEEELTFSKNDNGKFIAQTTYPIDTNFDIEYIVNGTKCTGPKVINANNGLIEISAVEYDWLINNTCKVKYIKQRTYEE